MWPECDWKIHFSLHELLFLPWGSKVKEQEIEYVRLIDHKNGFSIVLQGVNRWPDICLASSFLPSRSHKEQNFSVLVTSVFKNVEPKSISASEFLLLFFLLLLLLLLRCSQVHPIIRQAMFYLCTWHSQAPSGGCCYCWCFSVVVVVVVIQCCICYFCYILCCEWPLLALNMYVDFVVVVVVVVVVVS